MTGHEGARRHGGTLLASLWVQTLDRPTSVSATSIQSNRSHGEESIGVDAVIMEELARQEGLVQVFVPLLVSGCAARRIDRAMWWYVEVE